jgi:glutaredoxin 3
VIVYIKTYCPHSAAAKKLLASKTIPSGPATVIELDTRDDGAEIQSYLASISGQSTVPSIWIDGEFIGGCSELQALEKNGKLDGILSKL